jgi:hypothetical protein
MKRFAKVSHQFQSCHLLQLFYLAPCIAPRSPRDEFNTRVLRAGLSAASCSCSAITWLGRFVKILDQSMDHKMIIKQLSGTIHSRHLLNRRSCCYGHLCCRACRPGACLSWRSGAAGSARILTGAKIQMGPERQLHWLKRRCPAQKGMVQWWVPNKIYSLIRTILCDLIFVLYTYIYI